MGQGTPSDIEKAERPSVTKRMMEDEEAKSDGEDDGG